MNELSGKYQGLTISTETKLTGISNGNVTVKFSIIFHLNGMVIGDLILEDNSSAYLYGILDGKCYVGKNSTLKVYGIIRGQIIHNVESNIYIDQNAKVEKQ